MRPTVRPTAPDSIHADRAPVAAWAAELARMGKDLVVITVPPGSAAYAMGYRFTTCARDELPDYLAGGATVADGAP